ncbi:alkaline phosphatase family protein [Echinicola sp. CAU 1574]|uniref:Alkaline phosphatase family protein n=1 Tax=Echinicola arenosa TaxID=2774144 RepID=A0ABR9AJW4_9BACT|nr:alkaline phosphatase family protein [Echinicola arenosa]MBD8489046.1 alkaline phosphatase family protein [Echinicola arenosa]
MKRFLGLLGFLFVVSLNAHAQKTKKVLFIGTDGTRGEVLRSIPTPNLDLLTKKAIFSYDAINNGITISGPGWSNLFTGVGESKHGVIDNSFKNNQLRDHPDFLTVIKEQFSDAQTAAFYTWIPVGIILDKTDLRVEKKYSQNGDAYVHQAAIDFIKHEPADATVVYYGDVDIAGHDHGFYEDVPQYYEEIVQFDRYVGDLMDAIAARTTRSEEEWLILLSTDHGGHKTGHGGITLQERNIFVIVAGDNVTKREIKPKHPGVLEQDAPLALEDLAKYGYDQVPTQLDIVATIFDFLQIDSEKYGLEGKSLLK